MTERSIVGNLNASSGLIVLRGDEIISQVDDHTALKRVTEDKVELVVAYSAGLHRNSLGTTEIIGHSIANVGPTLTPALNISVVVALAGVWSWLSFVAATIGMMFVAAAICNLARRHPQSGSYFIYVGRTLGPLAGMVTGLCLIGAYGAMIVATIVSSSLFLNNALAGIGLKAASPPAFMTEILFAACAGLAAFRSIKMSSRLGLALEAVSLAIIIAVIVAALLRHGTLIDPVQLDFSHVNYGGTMVAMAFAGFSFVGFESSATLAREARSPTSAIPLALFVGAGGCGLFFIVTTYCMILIVGGDASVLANSGFPFGEISKRAGFAAGASVIYASALISAFACSVASVNALSRILFSMGRYGYIAKGFGRVHARHRTPHLAVLSSVSAALLISLALLPLSAVSAFGYAGTFSTFGFLIIYLLICVVSPLDAKRNKTLALHQVVLSIGGIIVIGFLIQGSLYPVPPFPYNLIPYLFAMYLAAGVAWHYFIVGRTPGTLRSFHIDHE